MVKNRGKAESIAAFEPSANTLTKLNDYILNTNEQPAKQITVFPCAVWDKEETLAFNNNDEEKATANSVSAFGNEQIQCVSIDEVLSGFQPTFIKMDVEGAEYNALLGAKSTICEYKPDLAICLYHSLADIWRIPLLIDSWALNYKFYIRAYRMFGYETVLYATCES
jgi:FkbM family methyltransferase